MSLGKLVVKAVSLTLLTSLSFCSLGDEVLAGSGMSCVGVGSNEPDEDGYFRFNNVEKAKRFLIKEQEEYIRKHPDDRHCENMTPKFKILLEGDIPERAFGRRVRLWNVEEVYLSGTTTIGCSSFTGLENLSRCSFPEGLTTIGWGAFEGTKLSGCLTFPSTLKTLSRDAFAGCKFITSVVLPEGLERMEDGCFNGCKSLSSAVLPHSMKYFGSFRGTKLVRVELPCLSKYDCCGLFWGCDCLREIVLPDGVEEISMNVFGDDDGDHYVERMHDVTLEISNSVNEIHEDFCCNGDHSRNLNPGITRIKWNSREFSGRNCVCSFLNSFEQKSGNTVHRVRGPIEGKGDPGIYPNLRQEHAHNTIHAVVFWKGKKYDSIRSAIAAGVSLDEVTVGTDYYTVYSLESALRYMGLHESY